MIYLIDRGFRINNALIILVNQCKCPGIYNECFCLGCNVNDKYNVNNNDNDNDNDDDNDNDNDNDKDNDSYNDNVNIKDNDNDNDNDKDNDNDNDNVNDNDNDNVNDNVNDNFIYLFDEKHQRGKPNNKEYLRTDSVCGKRSGFTDLRSSYGDPRSTNFVDLSNNISVSINEDLQSWLNDDNIIKEATLPENFRSIISGPSECGKKFLLKKTNSG